MINLFGNYGLPLYRTQFYSNAYLLCIIFLQLPLVFDIGVFGRLISVSMKFS
jgi:hypothetical protein